MSGAQTIHAGASLGLPAPWTDQTGTALVRPDGGKLYVNSGAIVSAAPNVVVTDNSTTGIGTALTQIWFATIPGGVMTPTSEVLVRALFDMTGNDGKTITPRVGPASGTYASSTNVGGQTGLTTQMYVPSSFVLWNNNSVSVQRAQAALAPTITHTSSFYSSLVLAIDTSLDWNIYYGVQFSVANGSPENTISLRRVTIEING